jgi:hypothetical protein
MRVKDQPSGIISNYTEFPAPTPLADRFLCFWTQTIVGSKGSYEHRVLPDGCIDIVVINVEEPMVVGPWTGPLVARFAAGTTITGARLRPGFASCLLGMPASELLNQSIPTVDAKGAARSIRLENLIAHPNSAARRSALAEALCLGRRPLTGSGCPGQHPLACPQSARPYSAIESMDRDKRASASSAIFGCHWLQSKDLSIGAAVPAPSQGSACDGRGAKLGGSRLHCRLRRSSPYDSRSPASCRPPSHGAAPFGRINLEDVRFVQDVIVLNNLLFDP